MMFQIYKEPRSVTLQKNSVNWRNKWGADCEYPGGINGVWKDWGTDGLKDEFEPGYDSTSTDPHKLDPNWDNYNDGNGPDNVADSGDEAAGTEGNNMIDGTVANGGAIKEMYGDGWSDYKEIYRTHTLPDLPNTRNFLLMGGGYDKVSNSPDFWNTLNDIYGNFYKNHGANNDAVEDIWEENLNGQGEMEVSTLQSMIFGSKTVPAFGIYANGELPNDDTSGDEPAQDPQSGAWITDPSSTDNNNFRNGFAWDDNMYSSLIQQSVPGQWRPGWINMGGGQWDPNHPATLPLKRVIPAIRWDDPTNSGIDPNDQAGGLWLDRCTMSLAIDEMSRKLGKTDHPHQKIGKAQDFLWIMINSHGLQSSMDCIWDEYGTPAVKMHYLRKEMERDLGLLLPSVTTISVLNSCYSGGFLDPAAVPNMVGPNRIFITSSEKTEESFAADGLDTYGQTTTHSVFVGTGSYPDSEPYGRSPHWNDYWESEFFYHFIRAFAPWDHDGSSTTPDVILADWVNTPTYSTSNTYVGYGNKNGEASILEAFNFVSGMNSRHSMYDNYASSSDEATACLEDDGTMDTQMTDLAQVDKNGNNYVFVTPQTASDDGYLSRHVYL
jgi:hypothetical protein